MHHKNVWTVLNDVEALHTLIRGVQSLEEIEPNTYKCVANVGSCLLESAANLLINQGLKLLAQLVENRL